MPLIDITPFNADKCQYSRCSKLVASANTRKLIWWPHIPLSCIAAHTILKLDRHAISYLPRACQACWLSCTSRVGAHSVADMQIHKELVVCQWRAMWRSKERLSLRVPRLLRVMCNLVPRCYSACERDRRCGSTVGVRDTIRSPMIDGCRHLLAWCARAAPSLVVCRWRSAGVVGARISRRHLSSLLDANINRTCTHTSIDLESASRTHTSRVAAWLVSLCFDPGPYLISGNRYSSRLSTREPHAKMRVQESSARFESVCVIRLALRAIEGASDIPLCGLLACAFDHKQVLRAE